MCAKKENKVTPRWKLHQKTSRKICQKRKEKLLTKKKQEKSQKYNDKSENPSRRSNL